MSYRGVSMKTVLSFNYLQAERDANRRLRDMRLEYPMDLFIEQVKLVEDRKAIISFRMKSATNPEVASFSVSGELRAEGTPEEISSALMQVDENPPAIWKDIYRDCINVMISLAQIIDIPFPSPSMDDLPVIS
jgi:hypothetical protein